VLVEGDPFTGSAPVGVPAAVPVDSPAASEAMVDSELAGASVELVLVVSLVASGGLTPAGNPAAGRPGRRTST